MDERVPGIYHLHTFGQCGQFTIRAERLENTATVVVYPEDIIRNQSKLLLCFYNRDFYGGFC